MIPRQEKPISEKPYLGPCTVVSLMPVPIREKKPLIPASFFIPEAKPDDIEVLVIEQADRRYYVDFDRGTLAIPEIPEIVAKSLVNDYIMATIHVTSGATPGLFYVRGDKTKEQVKREHPEEIKTARTAQTKWFERLVRAADDIWQRTRRHNTISDQHRLAARMLNLKREWSDILHPEDTIACAYCTTLISGKAIVCPTCRMPQQGAINQLPEPTREAVMRSLGAAGLIAVSPVAKKEAIGG